MDLVIGEPPEYPEELIREMETVKFGAVSHSVSTTVVVEGEPVGDMEPVEMRDPLEDNEVWQKYMKDMEDYWNKRQMVSGFVNLISPTNNFQNVVTSLTYPEMSYMTSSIIRGPMDEPGEAGVSDVLGNLLWNFVALAAIPAVFFGAAYVRFMRLDVR